MLRLVLELEGLDVVTAGARRGLSCANTITTKKYW